MSEPVLKWYVFETFVGAEWQVYRDLDKLGFEVWLGWYLDDVTRGRYKRGATRIYMEGYVFIRADRKWLRQARGVKGIKDLITYADRTPAPIPDDVMGPLIAALSTHFKVEIEKAPIVTIEEGQSRKLISGAFCGFIAQIARVVSFNVIEVWIDAMGRKVRIAVPPEDVSPTVLPQKHCA